MNAKSLCRTLLIALFMLGASAASSAHFFDVGISVGFAPPPLPVYEQPPVPGPGYIWTPGYWAYADDAGYYWVPGTWVLAPEPGLLWTPGYWGFVNNYFIWNAGYWGPHIGFYGGINYGCGYFGFGFEGGYWRDRDFFYNRAFTNITNVNITNVYNNRTINNYSTGSRASYNGGDGVRARPGAGELVAAHEPHRGMTSLQTSHERSARTVPSLQAAVNHGHPSIAATTRPGVLEGGNNGSIQHNAPGARGAPHGGPAVPASPARSADVRNTPTRVTSDANRQRMPAPTAVQNDRPPWARRTPESTQRLPRQATLPARALARPAGNRPPAAYGHATVSAPRASYAPTQSPRPSAARPYAPPMPLAHAAQPRASQGPAMPRSNAAGTRSSPSPRSNAAAPRHDARHA